MPPEKINPPRSWSERQEKLLDLARRQLFFIGGAPRSGTTWLQYLLDSHPDVSCRGEALLSKHVAEPLAKLTTEWRQAVEAKNGTVFRHDGGYPLPEDDDAKLLAGTAVLLALERQRGERSCHAIGEKTPENVFFFPYLKGLFPHAKFIGIARDPRDVLSSAWHFFRPAGHGSADERAAKLAFIRLALPSLQQGARTMLALRQAYPSDSMIITYEQLSATAEPVAAALFRFLGVADGEAIIRDCLARTSFAVLTGGRPVGVEQSGSFFRRGIVGGWSDTFDVAMNDVILAELGWMFPQFGWQP